jgi:hypothetical protein
MTPAEQYRTLIDRLQVLAEAVLTPQQIMDMTPQERVAKIVAMTPQEKDAFYDSLTTQEIEEILASWPKTSAPAPTTAPAGAYHTANSNSSPHQQDPAQVQQGMAQLQRRCQSLLYRLRQSAGPYDQQIMSRIAIKVTDEPEDDMYSYPSLAEIDVDYSQWNDAPDNVLLWNLGHEAGHICMTHKIKGNSPQQLQQQELEADAFATRLCLGMGISDAPAFKWANDKRDRLRKLQSVGTLHQNKLDSMSDPANAEYNQQSTHPTYQQRFDAAGQQGFKLGQADTDQLDRFLAHMSRTA